MVALFMRIPSSNLKHAELERLVIDMARGKLQTVDQLFAQVRAGSIISSTHPRTAPKRTSIARS